MSETEKHLVEQRKQKLEEIKKLGINPYPYTFNKKNNASEILEKFDYLKKEEHSKTVVSVAGRVMTLREMGKASFAHLQDQTGRIQIYVREDQIGEKNYQLFSLLDLGDIIGVEGNVARTKTGEVTVFAKKVELLCKSLKPLPDKWHGLKDVEIRYRKRYLDLIVNPNVKEVFLKRSKIITLMREYLDKLQFVEMETPLLQTVYGGAAAKPFKTKLNYFDMQVFLSVSPELYLKRLIVGGFERVYTICKNFRNEGIDSMHNPEFTMIELYQSYVDYNAIMELTESMIEHIAKKVNGTTKSAYRGKEIDFKKPWTRMTMKEALKKIGKIDVDALNDAALKKKCKELKIDLTHDTRDFMIVSLFDELVQEQLVQPTFITDYPLEVCPLTKVHRKNPQLVERFEAFVCGTELANAYSELTDPVEQRKRFQKQLEEKKEKEDAHLMVNELDEDFLESMEVGLPPLGGLGIGVDRLVMLLTGQGSLKDAILFPFMKPS